MDNKYVIGLSTFLIILASLGGAFVNQYTNNPDMINHYYKCDITGNEKFCEKISSTGITCTFYKEHIETYGKTAERCNTGWKQISVLDINKEVKEEVNNNIIGIEQACSLSGCIFR